MKRWVKEVIDMDGNVRIYRSNTINKMKIPNHKISIYKHIPKRSIYNMDTGSRGLIGTSRQHVGKCIFQTRKSARGYDTVLNLKDNNFRVPGYSFASARIRMRKNANIFIAFNKSNPFQY